MVILILSSHLHLHLPSSREVQGSILDPDEGYADLHTSRFSSARPEKLLASKLKKTMTVTFHILPNSSSTISHQSYTTYDVRKEQLHKPRSNKENIFFNFVITKLLMYDGVSKSFRTES